MADAGLADFQGRGFRGLADPAALSWGAAPAGAVGRVAPRRCSSFRRASRAGESVMLSWRFRKESSVRVDKCALFCDATPSLVVLCGCTLTETALPCPRHADQRR